MTPLEKAAAEHFEKSTTHKWANQIPMFKENQMRGMRAALATLMEPTEEMTEAARKELETIDLIDDGASANDRAWRAMLKKVING